MFGRKKNKSRQPQTRNSSQPRSAPVIRYYSANKEATPQKRTERVQHDEEKTLKARSHRFISLLPQRLVFIAIVALLLVNTTLSSAKVAIASDTTAYRLAAVYEQKISELFGTSFLQRSKLTFSSDAFEQQIISAFPEVSRAVAVVPIAGRNVQVYLEFITPLVRLTTTDNQEGVIGEGGVFVFLDTKSLDTSSLSELPVLTLKEQPEIQEGSQLLTSVESKLLALLKAEFDGSAPYRPQVSSIVFDVKKREMDVRFKGTSYFAKVTPERDAREGVGSLIATLKELEGRNAIPKEYIDVRVEDRVFIK